MRPLLSLSPRSRVFGWLGGSALLAASFASGCGGNSAGPDDGGTCVPTTTCATASYNCGQALDDCGNVLECGACAAGETCGAAGPNVCGVGACTPATCQSLGLSCGPMADGCGQVWTCGDCGTSGTGGEGSGTGGTGAGGTSGGTGGTSGGTGGTSGGTGGTSGEIVVSPLGQGVFAASGSITTNGKTGQAFEEARYAQGAVKRDSDFYFFIANGWGPGFGNHTISWEGTSFTASVSGSAVNGAPAGYPTVFCGNYADKTGLTKCGLPQPISALTSLRTGWRWAANGNTGQYNAAWDVWIGNGTTLQSYLMVWLRDPAGQQPAGSRLNETVTIAGQTWDIWTGSVNGHPIVNYVRPEGSDIYELEFDVLDFYENAKNRGLQGTHINSVAVGFEVWNNATNVESIDFYVDPRPR